MQKQMDQDRQDLVEARDFDQGERDRSREEQQKVKEEYDRVFAEHKERKDEFGLID